MKKIQNLLALLILAVVSCTVVSPSSENFAEIADKNLYKQVAAISGADNYEIIDNELYVLNDSLYCSRVKVHSEKRRDYIILDYVYIKIRYDDQRVKEKSFFQNPITYGMKDLFKWGDEEYDKFYGKINKKLDKEGFGKNNILSKEEKLYSVLYMLSVMKGETMREYEE